MHRKLWFLFLHLPLGVTAQNTSLGSWNILNIKYVLNERVNVFGEAQIRSLAFYDQFHYYEYKGGIQYKPNKNISIALGAGSYQTYKEGGNFRLPKNNNEFRIWPQIALNQTLGSLKIEQRYRTEFRFTSNGYRNRFRYRLGLSHPFGKSTDGYKPFQISVNNEIFFTNREPYFERNRLGFGLHYKPNRKTTLQIGYLHQFDYRINDETGRDFLQVGYFIEIFKKRSARSEDTEVLKEN